ncbi:SDR family NAD(P)-dependent oxidoreductase [Amycolatopsis sp. 195334CR]|uniref:SDR family NAD(P)-dependent oxidoreductase n=1 Tax=Amycolatopsis sp. 195334CR TaxID=2814588 RepID=UPI001A90C645|nr:SDR family NAD(P)-dependent oxidoreductase [Amycolatopsis sp. 195334CR]MBN6037723.1 SDR family NAD(P)-dependent oxidoreductase [Amycolatopsis sp. 195334CR]
MAKTVVVTGGTDGIGAALVRALAERGDRAVVLGRNRERGARLVREGAGLVSFLETDLSLMSNTREAAKEIAATHPAIDGLVFCARFFQTHRTVTAEGLEHNFALFYLSRAVLGEGLAGVLGDHAVVINVAGPGHDTPIAWDDLQSTRHYDGVRAMFQAGRLNDLLGVDFAAKHPGIAYVLFHPGTTATGFAGDYDPATAAFIEQQKAQAKPATDVVPPLLALLDGPPRNSLSAFHLRTELTMRDDSADAARLARLTSSR